MKTSAQELKAKIKTVSEKEFNVTWIQEESHYLRGVFVTSIMRFPDDVEFFYDEGKGELHFRSESRYGYSDLGANRDRIALIKSLLEGKQ